jgi:hypothetical protein
MNGHLRVPNDKSLYRRGYGPSNKPDKRYLNPDGTSTSRNFVLRPHDEGRLSVDITELTTPERSVVDPIKYVLFEISVSDVESFSLSAYYEPYTIAEHRIDNQAHGYIFGMEEDDDVLPGLLARAARRIFIDV